MAEKNGSGPDKQVLEFKTGNGFEWVGLRPDFDPQDLEPNVPRQLANYRLVGGRIESRGGQFQVNAFPGKVINVIEHGPGAKRPIFALFSTEDEAPEPAVAIGAWDQEAYVPGTTIKFKILRLFTGHDLDSSGPIVMGVYGDSVLYGYLNAVYKMPPTEDWTEPVIISGENSDELVFHLPNGYNHVSAIMEHQGKAIIGCVGSTLDDSSTNSALFSWDGTTLTNELSSIKIVRGLAAYQDMLVAVFDGSPNSIRVRNSSGSWGSPIAPAAGTIGTANDNGAKSYRNVCYIAPSNVQGGADRDCLWSFNGSVVAKIDRTTLGIPGTPGDLDTIVVSVDVFDGYLYYLWYSDLSGSNKAYVGRFDGTTWEAEHRDLSNDYDGIVTGAALKTYMGSIWLGLQLHTDGYSVLTRSERTLTDQDYIEQFNGTEEDLLGTGDNILAIRQLLQF